MNEKLDAPYWSARYLSGQTGWDIGYAVPALCAYADQLEEKSLRILIPGCGSGYEGEYLHRQGFTSVALLDLAPEPLARFAERVSDFPKENLIQHDFFALEGQYDLILEHTFFCALAPSQREAYVQKAASLLSEGGRLVGLLFDDALNTDKPPFGGSKAEYEQLFSAYFQILTMETCYNSIAPRAGRELFVILEKK